MLYSELLQTAEKAGVEIPWIPEDWQFAEITKMSVISPVIQILEHQWLLLFAHPDLWLQYECLKWAQIWICVLKATHIFQKIRALFCIKINLWWYSKVVLM